MEHSLPLYLASPPPSASTPTDDPRLSFPASVHSLYPDNALAQRRDSFRPPLPPKPAQAAATLMRRSLSAGLADPPLTSNRSTTGTASAGNSPNLSVTSASPDPIAQERKGSIGPMHWMRAMGYDDNDTDGSDGSASPRFLDGIGLGLAASTGGRSGTATPTSWRGSEHLLPFQARPKEPPAVPPRPGREAAPSDGAVEKLSAPPLQPTPDHPSPSPSPFPFSSVSPPAHAPSASEPLSPSSSAPPALSPFMSASTAQQPFAPAYPTYTPTPAPGSTLASPSAAATPTLASTPPASAAASMPPPPPRRPLGSAGSAGVLSSSSSVVSGSSAGSSGGGGGVGAVLGAVNRGLQHAKLKDRFGAGVGFAREWGGKGRSRVQEGWRGFGAGGQGGAGHRSAASVDGDEGWHGGTGMTASASSPQLDGGMRVPKSPSLPGAAFSASSSSSAAPSSSTAGAPKATVILGVKVPALRSQAFGVPLAPLVASTRTPAPQFAVPRSDDEVCGDDARCWLPGVAFRCLQYLDEWGRKEEGIYRIPGQSKMVGMLRTMYDAGVGQELDLREIHPGDLDPAAVASLFKSWLREIPESLLSPALEPLIDALTLSYLGYSASSSHFLGSAVSSTAAPSSPLPSSGITHGAPPAPPGLVDGRAPREYTEQLREAFATRLEAENYFLLRAIAYHLARLAAHSNTNKMTLTNLRLILSPTLRLSPGFLQVLVVEREILFSKANESARRRQASASTLATPPLPQSSSFAPPSPSLTGRTSPHLLPPRSPTPGGSASPLLNPPSPALAPLSHSASATSTGSWLVVEDPASLPSAAATASSPTLTTSFAPPLPPLDPSLAGTDPHRLSPQTPIADRFASTSPPAAVARGLTLAPASSSSSLREAFSASSAASPASVSPKPAFLPTRDRAAATGFFSAGSLARDPAPAQRRKGSASSASSSTGGGGERTLASDAPHSLDAVRLEPGRLSLGMEFAALALEGEGEAQERLADPATQPRGLPRLASRSSSLTSTSASNSSASSSFVATPGPESGFSAASGARPTTMDLTLPMPSGLSLALGPPSGVGAGAVAVAASPEGAGGKGAAEVQRALEEGEGDGWGLLSVEERRKFFGG
ncbi:hypothetical protein JCM10207_001468 [Rhodosporidiobolus poonsookiae]